MRPPVSGGGSTDASIRLAGAFAPAPAPSPSATHRQKDEAPVVLPPRKAGVFANSHPSTGRRRQSPSAALLRCVPAAPPGAETAAVAAIV